MASKDKDTSPIVTQFGRLLNVKEVAAMFGIAQRTVWQMAVSETIPQPIHLSPRVVRWRLIDLEAHIRKLAS